MAIAYVESITCLDPASEINDCDGKLQPVCWTPYSQTIVQFAHKSANLPASQFFICTCQEPMVSSNCQKGNKCSDMSLVLL